MHFCERGVEQGKLITRKMFFSSEDQFSEFCFVQLPKLGTFEKGGI